jgi:hypothetical protein
MAGAKVVQHEWRVWQAAYQAPALNYPNTPEYRAATLELKVEP